MKASEYRKLTQNAKQLSKSYSLPDPESEDARAMWERIGRALSLWAVNENTLSMVYANLVEAKRSSAASEGFASILTVDTKRDVFDAAVRARFLPDDPKATAGLRYTKKYVDAARIRNQLAHCAVHQLYFQLEDQTEFTTHLVTPLYAPKQRHSEPNFAWFTSPKFEYFVDDLDRIVAYFTDWQASLESNYWRSHVDELPAYVAGRYSREGLFVESPAPNFPQLNRNDRRRPSTREEG